jgi:N-acetylmuramoyl-L-alanine amidase
MFFKSRILLTFILAQSFLCPAHAFLILIDPGHGGFDKGAQQANYSESDIVWAWSLELKKLLLEKGFEVELTRAETKGLPLQKRLSRVNQKNYDLILSLHANYLLDARVKGIEYYIPTPLNLEDQKLQLAHEEIQLQKGQKKVELTLSSLSDEQKSQVGSIIQDLKHQTQLEQSLRIAEQLNQAWPGKVKQGPFDLLAKADSTAILIELGYLSNPADLKSLVDPQFRLEKTLKLTEVLVHYFKNNKTSQSD